MDRHLGADFDRWLTTEPDDDFNVCENGYPEHDFHTDGSNECRWCGALGPEPDQNVSLRNQTQEKEGQPWLADGL